MAEFNAQYIEDHSHRVHTADSFARSLVYSALQEARKSIKPGDKLVTIDAKISVSAIESLGCIRICVETPIGVICYHQEV